MYTQFYAICSLHLSTYNHPLGMRLSGTSDGGAVVSREGIDPCEAVKGDPSYEFCSSSVGATPMQDMKAYKHARSSCDWRPFPGEKSYIHDDSLLTAKPHTSIINTSGVQYLQCRKQMTDEETLHIYKTGPITSFGNEAWHSLGLDNVLAEYIGKTDFGMKGYLIHPVDDNGEAFGRPPLQIHHWHTAEGQCDLTAGWSYWPTISIQQTLNSKVRPGARHPLFEYRRQDVLKKFNKAVLAWTYEGDNVGSQFWSDVHGDRQCLKDMGGTDCLLRRFPKGFSMQFHPKREVCGFVDIVDVRSGRSTALNFWVESAYIISRNDDKPLFFMGGNDCPLIQILTSEYRRYEPLTLNNPLKPGWVAIPGDGYDFNTSTEGVAWRSFSSPVDADIVFTFFHSHNMFTDGILLLKGDPADLGLHKLDLWDFATRTLRDLKHNDRGLDFYKQLLTDAIQLGEKQGKIKTLCSRRSDVYEFAPEANYTYERFQPPLCRAWPMRKGDIITAITYHRTLPEFADQAWRHPTVQMHTVPYLYAVTPSGSKTKLDHVQFVPREDRESYKNDWSSVLASSN